MPAELPAGSIINIGAKNIPIIIDFVIFVLFSAIFRI